MRTLGSMNSVNQPRYSGVPWYNHTVYTAIKMLWMWEPIISTMNVLTYCTSYFEIMNPLYLAAYTWLKDLLWKNNSLIYLLCFLVLRALTFDVLSHVIFLCFKVQFDKIKRTWLRLQSCFLWWVLCSYLFVMTLLNNISQMAMSFTHHLMWVGVIPMSTTFGGMKKRLLQFAWSACQELNQKKDVVDWILWLDNRFGVCVLPKRNLFIVIWYYRLHLM